MLPIEAFCFTILLKEVLLNFSVWKCACLIKIGILIFTEYEVYHYIITVDYTKLIMQ